mmetsp:Transcript_26180/g.52166  ORF Transcript_26180/g.52166 Transcript_26180/m.52166 type:complete len:94 (+) Transcript_26180:3-284(+)
MKSDAIEIALSPFDIDTISYSHVVKLKNSGRKQKFGKMRSFFTRPKSRKKSSKAFDDDGDLSLVTTLSGVSAKTLDDRLREENEDQRWERRLQ